MRRLLISVAVILAIVAAYSFFAGGSERAVRDRIQALAELLSAPAGEEPLARASRFASLRVHLAPGIRVELPGEGISLQGTDEVSGFALRAAVPAAGILVETGGIDVEIQPDRETADARFSARILERRPDSEPWLLDARTVALTLVRHDRTWRISSARIMPSDDTGGR